MSAAVLLLGIMAAIVAAAIATLAGALIADAIRSRHPNTWRALGEPSPFFMDAVFMFRSRHMVRHIVTDRFKALNDSYLTLLCGIFWICGGLTIVIAASTFVAALFSLSR